MVMLRKLSATSQATWRDGRAFQFKVPPAQKTPPAKRAPKLLAATARGRKSTRRRRARDTLNARSPLEPRTVLMQSKGRGKRKIWSAAPGPRRLTLNAAAIFKLPSVHNRAALSSYENDALFARSVAVRPRNFD